MHIDISVDCEHWRALGDLDGLTCETLAAACRGLADRRLDAAEVSVSLLDDAAIRALNREYRGHDRATNVLSFPQAPPAVGDAPWMLGDIVLAWSTVSREAAAQAKRPADHYRHLLVHGFLHLLGYDHLDEVEARAMEQQETRILSQLGIADPYAAVPEATEADAHPS